MKQTLNIAAFVLGLCVVTGLAAEEVKMFEELDVDSDGYISKKEAMAQKSIEKNWKKADKDNDGRLDISEFSAFEAEGAYVPPEDREIAEPGAAPLD
jgi:hypothetical protein